MMAVDRSISKADQLRPQHPWITTCWKLGVGKYTLGASQIYKSSSQNLLERLDFLWVFLAGPESREQRDGNNWLETRHQQTINSEILVRLRSWRWLSWKSLSFCSSFIWYCPSLHVKLEWNAWGSSQNMVASDPKEARTKRRSESPQWPSKNMGLVGYPVDRQLFFFTLEPLNGCGIDFQRVHEQFQRLKADIVLLPFLFMNISMGIKKHPPHIQHFLEFPMGENPTFWQDEIRIGGRDRELRHAEKVHEKDPSWHHDTRGAVIWSYPPWN